MNNQKFCPEILIKLHISTSPHLYLHVYLYFMLHSLCFSTIWIISFLTCILCFIPFVLVQYELSLFYLGNLLYSGDTRYTSMIQFVYCCFITHCCSSLFVYWYKHLLSSPQTRCAAPSLKEATCENSKFFLKRGAQHRVWKKKERRRKRGEKEEKEEMGFLGRFHISSSKFASLPV